MTRPVSVTYLGTPSRRDLSAIGKAVASGEVRNGDTVQVIHRRLNPSCKLDEGNLNVAQAQHQTKRVRRTSRAETKAQKASAAAELTKLRAEQDECIARAEVQTAKARGRMSGKKSRAVAAGGRRRWEKKREAQDVVLYELENRQPTLMALWREVMNQDRWFKPGRTSPAERFVDWAHDNQELIWLAEEAAAEKRMAAELAEHYAKAEAPF